MSNLKFDAIQYYTQAISRSLQKIPNDHHIRSEVAEAYKEADARKLHRRLMVLNNALNKIIDEIENGEK